jgi:hypothetical protein
MPGWPTPAASQSTMPIQASPVHRVLPCLVTATAGWFRNVVSDRRLQTECRMGLSDEVQADRKLRARVYKELSLYGGRPIRWVKGPREDILEGEDPELPELCVTCTIVHEPGLLHMGVGGVRTAPAVPSRRGRRSSCTRAAR